MAHGMMVLAMVVDHLAKKDIKRLLPIAGHGKSVDKTLTMLNARRSSITLWNKDNCVLLGHSFAGTIIAKVAEAIGSHSTTHLLRCFCPQ